MQHTTHKLHYLGLVVLLLALLLTFSPLASQGSAHAQTVRAAAPSAVLLKQGGGKMIVVSLSRQWLFASENGRQVFSTPVMSGRDNLPTPTGTYSVFAKFHPTTFTSPFPPGSPEWYPPTYINYALEFKAGGFFLHDSWWHSVYGPGSNRWHHDPVHGWQNGSHGCVAMALGAAIWLYNWAPIGTTVQINP